MPQSPLRTSSTTHHVTEGMVSPSIATDRTRERCLHIAGAALVGAAGFGATAAVHTPIPGLVALSVAAMGVFSAIPVFWSLPTTFLSGTAAAGAIALINSLGNLGGFVGPYLIGRVRDMTGGFAGSLIAIAVLLVGSAALAVSLRRSTANEGDVGISRTKNVMAVAKTALNTRGRA
jgi:ACS family tartrate transporter-like MFS transporter